MENKFHTLGINTDWGRPNCDGKYGGVGWYRIINPLEKLGADVIRGKFELKGAQTALDMKQRGDIWVTKHIDSLELITEILVDRDFTGSKLILDFDDDPFNLNKEHPAYEAFTSRKPLYERFIKGADHIICSTEAIKSVIEPLNNHITVIPNAIDPKIWNVNKTPIGNPNIGRCDGKIRIGWFGSSSHLADMNLILPVIEELEKKYPNVEFHLVGFADTKITEGRRFHYPPTKGYEEYPQFVADMAIDIAIAPLIDTQFNRAKSNIKWLEHSMLKTPMVLSNVSPYKECVENYKTGFLATGTNQWVKYLSWLIENPEKRKEIGENAHQAVLKDWLIEKQLPKYEKLLNSMQKHDITVYTSIIGGYNKLGDSPKQGGADYISFSDERNALWDVKKPYDKFRDDRRNSRIQKIMPHLFIDTEYSIYLDGNIDLLVPPQKLIDEWLKDKDIAVFRHVGRDCIYEEAQACIGLNKGSVKEIGEQVSAMAKNDYPKHAGLSECGVIVRRHTPRINELNERWWIQYERYSERDQLSFPTVFPQDEINQIESSVWRHPYFKFNPHLK